MNAPLRIVKVGGSLYDLPDLPSRLGGWLGPTRTLLVPGGGPTAEAIRMLDRVHALGEEAAHWLALRALSVNAHFLARLLPGTPIIPSLPRCMDAGSWFILDAYAFLQEDDARPGALPHCWSVTSDSLAVRVAVCAEARELVLLKSVAPAPGERWDGMVDPYFAEALRQAQALQVRIVNLRQCGPSSAV
jgi:aspartokinase-like uncharacterized kinase